MDKPSRDPLPPVAQGNPGPSSRDKQTTITQATVQACMSQPQSRQAPLKKGHKRPSPQKQEPSPPPKRTRISWVRPKLSKDKQEDMEDSASRRRSDRLLDPKDFPKVFWTIMSTLNLGQPGPKKTPTAPTPGSEFDARSVLPTLREPLPAFPLPPGFLSTIQKESASSARRSDSRIPTTKFYKLSEECEKMCRQPVVDAPVAALESPSVLPLDSVGFPKNPRDRRVEVFARRSFKAASGALKASVAASLSSRTAILWLRRLMGQAGLPRSARSQLRKMESRLAFAADASFDAMRLSARAMASAVVIRRITWLRNWDADSSDRAKLVGLPFRGSKLFGEGLEPFLLETKDKRKVLPSRRNPPRHRQLPSRPRSRRSFWDGK